jgi:RNA polymerase sigma-70 factor (ECF subfamily)
MDEDCRLIEQTLNGHRNAFGELVARYQDRLYTMLVHLVGCPEEARDVCQEAFTQAFVKLDSFHQASAFYTWLYRIAFNTAISRTRRKRPQASVDEIREAAHYEPPDPGPSPEERLQSEEHVKQVQAALATLSEDHRSILVLKEMDGLRYEEIAEMLDIPIGTVRSRLFRARSQLKECLQQAMPEDQPR